MDPISRTPTRPRDYAVLSAGYGGLLGGVLWAARRGAAAPVRDPELPALGLATFALAKLVTKEKVETWVREPFLEERPDGERRPRGAGLRYAMGELLSCSRCMGAWSAAGLVGLRLARPVEARAVISVLAVTAVNDWLQTGFTTLCARANLDQRAANAPPPEAGERRVDLARPDRRAS